MFFLDVIGTVTDLDVNAVDVRELARPRDVSFPKRVHIMPVEHTLHISPDHVRQTLDGNHSEAALLDLLRITGRGSVRARRSAAREVPGDIILRDGLGKRLAIRPSETNRGEGQVVHELPAEIPHVDRVTLRRDKERLVATRISAQGDVRSQLFLNEIAREVGHAISFCTIPRRKHNTTIE